MVSGLEKKLLLANRLLIFLVLLTPLIVSKLFVLPFEVPRLVYFRILTELLLVAYVWLALRYPQYRPQWRNRVVLSILIFTIVIFLSSIFGAQFGQSWWGTLQRSGGLFNWLHLLVFFLALLSINKTSKDRLWLLRIFTGVSLLVALYALGQKFGLNVYESGVYRLTGTLGNAAMLAGYLLFGFYGFLYLGVTDRQRVWRWYYGLAAGLELLVIFMSQTRGSMIGLVFSFLFLLAWLSFSQGLNKKVKLSLRFGLLFLVLMVASLFIFKSSSLVKNNYLLDRFTDIKLDTTAQTRLYAWQGGWEAFKDKPILGWGYDNFRLGVNHYFDANFYNYVTGETWFDRAHNVLVEYLTTTGVIGLLSYLFIFFATVQFIFSLKKQEKITSPQMIILLSLWLAYFIHNLLVFDSLTSLLAWLFFLAFIAGLGKEEETEAMGVAKIDKYSFIYLPLLLILVILINIRWNIPLAQSSAETRNVMQLLSEKKYSSDVVYQDLESSLNKNLPWEPEFIDPDVDQLTKLVREERTKINVSKVEEVLKLMDERITKLDKPELLDAKVYVKFARVYTLLLELNPKSTYYLEQARHYLDRSLTLSPQRIPTMYIVAQVDAFVGEYDKALAVLDQALALNPNIPQTYWSYALIYNAQNNSTEVINYVKQAIAHKFVFVSLDELNSVLPIFQTEKDYNSLEYLYKQAIELDKNNPQWYASLAATYKEQGKKQEAIDTVNRILDINPSYLPQVNEFINSLK